MCWRNWLASISKWPVWQMKQPRMINIIFSSCFYLKFNFWK
ncbi:hypothetical protein HMPREF3038_02417 [Akkermansia sp. KLE1797]|nr:hypothetical protein HMPREF3038_02417 [Akkermansia sp. KLE1797]KXU54851.1 hypothetical protein HMPREF3039_00998 [Akkermansia sp. KLE1798]KZA06235.1 hypothetical protein HMPREF1326_00083 [Akkermansia sp. KLE1605]